jgi:hypothetical protein
MRRVVFLLAVVVVTVASRTPGAAHTQRTVWDSVYTATQAARGETAYVKSCARCHKETLGGADENPALAGSAFLGNWNGQTLAALHDRIRSSMPPDDPGTFAPPIVTDVITHMLKVNGFPSGATELSSSGDSLKEIVVQSARP